MGKKNKEKVKEKKAAHKAHLAQLSAAQSRVAAANALKDPLAPFSIFQKYEKNSIQVSCAPPKKPFGCVVGFAVSIADMFLL